MTAKLTLVPPAPPTPAEETRQRIRKMPRPDGLLQCNRCGCRTAMTLVNGAFVKNGRKQGGTIINKDICSECWKRGVTVSMLPALKPAP